MKKYVFIICSVLILLFCISSMTYEQQTIVPTLQENFEEKPFYHLLSKIKVTYWGETISVETSGYYYFVEFLIRKCLHFFGYGFIGVLFYLLYRKIKWKFPVLLAIGTIFIIASLDEFRQTFVDGRTGIFDDVLLDTSGAITMIILYKVVSFIYLRFSSTK